MIKIVKAIIWTFFFTLLFINIFIFVKNINLGNEINRFEKETKQLRQENIELANQMYEIDSLQYAASIAAELDFVQASQVIYLDSLKYAFYR